MASIRSFIGAAGITVLGLSAACSAAPEAREESGTADQALSRVGAAKCPAGTVPDDCSNEGPRGSLVCDCVPFVNTARAAPAAGTSFWGFTAEGTAANTQGLAPFVLPAAAAAKMTAFGCSAPIDVNQGQPLFLCPKSATITTPLGLFSDPEGNPIPTCAPSTPEGPDPGFEQTCEALAFFDASPSGAVGTPLDGYHYVLDGTYTSGPISTSCPGGCPVALVPPPGGGVTFLP